MTAAPGRGEDARSSPVALVTGANRGIGREVARRLAQRGVTVLLGSRDPGRGAAAADELAATGVTVTPVVVDVTALATVRAAAAHLEAAHGRLDILVNNAGTIAPAGPLETDAEVMRQNFEVNVFGAVTMIRELIELLRRSPAPRVVNVSSTTASLALTAAGADLPGDASVRLAYTASKAALNMVTIQYAAAFARLPGLEHVKVNSATPGYTATDMNQHQGHRSVAEAATVIVSLATLPDDGPTGGFFGDEGPVPW